VRHIESTTGIGFVARSNHAEWSGSSRRTRAEPIGNLDRQSDCRYRARTAVRLAAWGKQALASLTSLRLAGRASIAAALRFHDAAQIAHCKRSW